MTNRFTYNQCVALEEDQHNEFKEVTSARPDQAIAHTADEYAVAFLNSDGGSIFWGIRNDRTVVGVRLSPPDRDIVRRLVSEKLNQVTPHVDPTKWRLEFHNVANSPQPDLYVVELSFPSDCAAEPYFTGSGEMFVRLNGVKQKLKGPQITAWIKTRSNSDGLFKSAGTFLSKFSQLVKPTTSHTDIVAERFLQIFENHGIAVSQIPRFLPQMTLDKLRNTETVLNALTGEILDKTSQLFGIRRVWLEGVDDVLYDYFCCYKSPNKFFDELVSLRSLDVYHPIIAFTCYKTLDFRSAEHQPIALVLCDHRRELGDDDVYRYRVSRDEWHWDYVRGRVQLKAMARVVYRVFHRSIPFYCIDRETMTNLRSGMLVPRGLMQGNRLPDLCLEDFGLSRTESAVSKEEEEMPAVLKFIEDNNLETYATKVRAALSEQARRSTS